MGMVGCMLVKLVMLFLLGLRLEFLRWELVRPPASPLQLWK